MVPTISSASPPVAQAGERLPVVPAAAVYARVGSQIATAPAATATAAVTLDPQQPNSSAAQFAGSEQAASSQTTVRDATLPPRRRAQDAAQAPGFPASPYVAQLLAQQAFPPIGTALEDGLAAYQATMTRGSAGAGSTLSLHA